MPNVRKGTGPGHGHPDQPPSREGSFVGNSSGPLFGVYSKIADKDDNAITEQQRKDNDGIIISACAVSAVVSICLLFSSPNLSVPSTPSAASTPPTSSPPQSIIELNLLWITSLCMSLFCAFIMTMVQQSV
ncbi:hypothetical protein BJV77DRAFT_1027535, partial [Russula vinacea]